MESEKSIIKHALLCRKADCEGECRREQPQEPSRCPIVVPSMCPHGIGRDSGVACAACENHMTTEELLGVVKGLEDMQAGRTKPFDQISRELEASEGGEKPRQARPQCGCGYWPKDQSDFESHVRRCSYWWCENCEQVCSPSDVTFEERHTLCGEKVYVRRTEPATPAQGAPTKEKTMPVGTYACPYCGKDTPHSHETKLALALPRLFEQLYKQERLLLHLGNLYCNDPSLSLRQFNVDATVKTVRAEIAEVKAAYESQLHEPLTPLEGMTYDREN